MADGAAPRTDHVEMAQDPAAFAHWPPGLHDELLAHVDNGCVGTTLLSETDRVRVWHLEIPVGGRFHFHRHVMPYFWTALTAGKARSYFADGRIADTEYFKGETRHFHYGAGESMAHSLENIGDTPLAFTTVEFLDGENPALEVPASVRL
ncbi:hypothetical protein [Histidinibacterium lentulum]|nr:hypothetical protein [Histidinibacterium lentulum]